MGSRGPVPDPKSERSVKGRNTSKARKVTPIAAVRMPQELTKNKPAAAMWKRLAPILLENGRLTPGTADALAMLCRLNAELTILEARLAKEGYVIESGRGPIANPIFRQAAATRNCWVGLARDFGLTAASAARLPEIEDGEEEDPLGEFA
jgi:P27 family predicted phage terminase small subunit